MHEVGLVSAAAAGLAAETRGRRIRAVTVALGPRVDRDVAAAAWHHAVGDTTLAGADVEWVPALDGLSCFTCGQDYEGGALDRCPACGGDGLVVAPAGEVVVAGWRPR